MYSWCSVAKSCLTLCNSIYCSTEASLSSVSPIVCSDSCLLSQSCYRTISSSAAPFIYIYIYIYTLTIYSDIIKQNFRGPRFTSYSRLYSHPSHIMMPSASCTYPRNTSSTHCWKNKGPRQFSHSLTPNKIIQEMCAVLNSP